ncbi:EAL domain-containing protein [Phormidium sp. LEGE 05292]|uniref:two-component system response regulator n=1 Tax=[Phormidium] sp. LEGE 05292 TaxID=767427 RepID=UPI00187DECFE|nr:GGDEF domain-containing response regulator [Phormidium sp. LEGE 05292]MBE9227374.1 EAL domain-containing protein [Phormidium sp. LEGE 05292]
MDVDTGLNEQAIVNQKEDILIVDDTPENLRLLSSFLVKEGYNVRKALTGQMALTAMDTVLPDLILLDIMMPAMDGYQVCEKLKSNPKTTEIPVIFLSALNDAFDKVKAFAVGGADYITKPFQFEEVLARVRIQLSLKTAKLQNKKLNAELEARVKERTYQLQVVIEELKREIQERKLLQTKLLNMALHDSLTGLPNRAFFMERLVELLKVAQENTDYQFAVLFLDCDRFKVINDSLGHLVGDELLIALTHRLKSILSLDNTIARFGGDEFAILLPEIDNINTAIQVADRILKALSFPFQLQRNEVFINASIGVALGNYSYEQAEHILRDADTAMYRAKILGKGQYHVFDPAMHAAAMQALQIENDLRKAIQQEEFLVHYQPIISLITGKITGFEALVRWQHPTKGIIPPGLFIPLAEETGLINSIGKLVLSKACHQIQQWYQDKLTNESICMSVNISARQFAQLDIVEQIDQIVTETQINPENLKLEITESAFINNAQSAKAILQELRQRKIQLSIDDFGTGYSSLSYLHNFPVDTLKVDRSFVSKLDGTSESLGLIPAIKKIAETMKMTVVAEGIETEKQLAQLRELNCEFGQGYFFAKPLPEKDATELLVASPRW